MVSAVDNTYRALQRHLDKQPVGYPATRTGADLKLLRRFFTPEEARLALNLSYKAQTEADICTKTTDWISSEQTVQLLNVMAKKLVIGHIDRNGQRSFFLIPLIVGMFEGQITRLTPEFITDFEAYVSDRAFGLSFLATELPQMRTIPVGKSIVPKHHVASFDQLEQLLAASEGPFVILPCICRKASRLKGKPCVKTQREETCLAVGNVARRLIDAEIGREIKLEETLSLSRESEAEGLVFQPSNSQSVEFVCACCGCCCGMLSIHKMLPRPIDFWASNFRAALDRSACSGCGVCVERCQVDAMHLSDVDGTAFVDGNRCIGCGNCIPTCPSGAIELVRKDTYVEPPGSIEDLYEIIMANKKGAFGKMKLSARLMMKRNKSKDR